MGFTKLSSRITKSSLWSEECYVRVVFLSFLAEKDENGFVESDYYAMQRTCNVTIEEFDKAVKILESKDDRSRTPDNDGKRIKRVQGGWIVLNHEMYKLPEDVKREQTRLRVQRYRSVTEALQSVTDELPSVSVSDSVSVLRDRESMREEEIETLYKEYPRKKAPARAKKAIKAALGKVSYDILLSAVKSYAETVKGKDMKYVPYPASWFNGECWNDEADKAEEYDPLIHGTRLFK